MRLVPLIVAAVGLAGAATAIALSAYSLRTGVPAVDPASEIRSSVPGKAVEPAVPLPVVAGPTAPVAPAQPARPPVDPVPPASPRAVAPSVVAMPPLDPQVLERVDPRPPLSELSVARAPKKPPPKPLLFRPVGEAAGVIAAGGRTITIANVEIVTDDATCAGSDGGQWPCGRAARTAFRAFLRGRAVTCDLPEGEVPDKFATTCRVGPRDIGEWLVANGWSRATGDAYRDQAKAAREGGKGIFGAAPAALPAELSAGEGAARPMPEPVLPEDISILPDTTATGATGTAPSPQAVGPAEGVSPLPPPASPLR